MAKTYPIEENMGKEFTLNTKLTVILVVFLAIGLINSSIIYFVVHQQEANGRAINLAGRQRMLTQKMSKESFLLLQAKSQEELKTGISDLKETSALFDKTLKGLINGDQEQGLSACTDKKVLQKLQEVKQLWTQFQGHIKDLIEYGPDSSRGHESLNAIQAGNLPLLKAMNEAVLLHEKSNTDQNILTFQGILLAFTIPTVFVAWFFTRKLIIKP